MFEVKRTVKTFTRIELEVIFVGERLNNDGCDLRVIGSPFKKSCSIYKDTDLVAQVYLLLFFEYITLHWIIKINCRLYFFFSE